MIVRTFDGLQALTTPPPTWGSTDAHLGLYGLTQAYADIYRTQPNVRICVDFLARNTAQIGVHVFRRISDTDRERLPDHELARWLAHPNPTTTRYRLMESLMSDLGIYFEAYWLKVRYRDAQGRPAIGLVRLPPEEMKVEGGLLPSNFIWSPSGKDRDFAPSEIVYFNGYNPCNALRGLSPLETLRRILAEEVAASDHREAYWRNAGRHEAVIEVSKDGPDYKSPQLQSFREQLQEFAGRGIKVGQTLLLPKGMTHKSTSFSAKDSEYIQGGKLRREVCAAEYHIPQPMVGILDHATFSNIRAQHQHTYQDTLAPWHEMITEAIELQLLIECEDQDNIYTEFNIAEKLKGSFEEQASSLSTLTGRPIMTANEARARLNLPRDPDPESDRIAPQQGGPATNPAPDPSSPDQSTLPADASASEEETLAQELATPIIAAARARQHARLQKEPPEDRASVFLADIDRWNRELVDDLTVIVGADAAIRLAIAANVETLRRLDALEATV